MQLCFLVLYVLMFYIILDKLEQKFLSKKIGWDLSWSLKSGETVVIGVAIPRLSLACNWQGQDRKYGHPVIYSSRTWQVRNNVEFPFLISSILIMQTLASIRIIYTIDQNNKIDKRQTKLLFGNEDGPSWMECCGEVTKPLCVLMGIIWGSMKTNKSELHTAKLCSKNGFKELSLFRKVHTTTLSLQICLARST